MKFDYVISNLTARSSFFRHSPSCSGCLWSCVPRLQDFPDPSVAAVQIKDFKRSKKMSYGRPPPRIDGMVSLKVDNLTYRTTPEDLRRVFERCGEVGDIYIPRDRFTRESRGFAFVRYVCKRI